MKDPSHLTLIGRDFHPLVLSDNLNGLEPFECIFYELKTS
jgi:hypothetical protein